MFLYYFSKNSFVVKHSGKNEIPNLFRIFFRKSEFFLSRKITKFSVRTLSIILIFEKKKYEIGCMDLVHILLSPFLRAKCQIAKCHFLNFPASSFMPRVTYVQYLTPCGVTTGSVTRLTSMLLERQQQDVRSSIWLYYKAPDVPVNTMTAPSGRGRRMHITLQSRDRHWKWKAEKQGIKWQDGKKRRRWRSANV